MTTTNSGLFTASLPELYEKFLVEPLFRPFAEALLERAGLRGQDRLVDVACGTGIVARLAHAVIGEGGRIVGVLGVVGPTRMAYDRVIPIVDATAKLLSAALNS